MRILNWVLAGVAIGVIASAIRSPDWRQRLAPAHPDGRAPAGGAEPVLGYDGMDQETLLQWLPDARLDRDTLEDILLYEEANLQREPVITTLVDMLG